MDHPHTIGQGLLRAFLAGPPKRTQEWLADTLGTSQANISLWLSGKFRPSDEYREGLEILTGIPRDAWRTEKEREVVLRALTFVASNHNDKLATGTG